jgi:Lrp/AsnC family transcriptional regulator
MTTATLVLDPLDRRLLQAVQRQADLSHAALAEAVGTSPASCWRRLKALEDAGVLGPPCACSIRLRSASRSTRSARCG